METLVPYKLLVIFLLFGHCNFVSCQCVDRPHYYYKCSQLSKYCKYPQATRIRKSCPVTCGVCEEQEGFRRTITFDSSQLGIIKPLSPVQNDSPESISFHSGPSRQIPVLQKQLPQQVVGPTGTVLPRPPNVLMETRNTAQPDTPEVISPKAWTEEQALFRTEKPQFQDSAFSPPVKQRGSLERLNRHAVTDPEALFRLEACCRHAGISSQCLSLCTYDTTKKEILAKAVSGSCTMSDARIWVQCAAGGQRNQACCERSGVTGCDELCNGQFPQNFNQLLTCVNQFLHSILSCHKANLTP